MQKSEIVSLPDQIFISLKQSILAGDISGGERVSEIKLSEQYGVSRTPIREALRKLEQYGFISIFPRKYVEVLKLSPIEVEKLTELRVVLEKLAIEEFIKNGNNEDLLSIEKLANQCNDYILKKDIGNFYEADSLFHLEIAKGSKNPFLYDAMGKLDAKVQLSRLLKPLDFKSCKVAITEHCQILELLKTKNIIESKDSMEKHIRNNL